MRIDEAYLAELRTYFAAMQPDWQVLPEQSILRAGIGDQELQAEHYTLRVLIDVDLRLAETPQELERLMLLQIIRTYHAAIRDLLQKGARP